MHILISFYFVSNNFVFEILYLNHLILSFFINYQFKCFEIDNIYLYIYIVLLCTYQNSSFLEKFEFFYNFLICPTSNFSHFILQN